jgi:uncharacterized protein
MIEIKTFKKVDMKGYSFIEGFPGIGLVGPMSVSYIIDKLGMEYIGYMESPNFPPLISIHKSEPMPPIRLYYSKQNKIATIFAEFAVPLDLVYELSDTIYSFLKANGMSRIYSISGTPIPTDATAQQKAPYAVASKQSLLKSAVSSGLQPIREGVSTGVGAVLLSRSSIDGFDNINVMVPVQQGILDPIYAQVAIKSLNKLMMLDIDTSDLEKEAQAVETKIREIISKHKESHDSYKKSVGASGPSMYA